VPAGRSRPAVEIDGGPPIRILLVEDEARVAAVVAKALMSDGRGVVLAEDGEVGLFLATGEPFDLVILDLGLPDASGLDVLRELRSRRLTLPIIILTGQDDPASRRACLSAGASAFVTKPFSIMELRRAVGDTLAADGELSRPAPASASGPGLGPVDEGPSETERRASVWVLTDSRYLTQRMPLALVNRLRELGVPFRLVIAEQQLEEIGGDVGDGDPWGELQEGDVVVGRTRNPFGLALLRTAERAGVRVCTPWGAVSTVRNKPRAVEVLARRAIPMPRTFLAHCPAALRSVPGECYPLILKPYLGDNARGIVVIHTPEDLDELDWTDAMALAQRYVDVGGVDLKLYVAGHRVWAVRRRSPLVGTNGGSRAAPAEVTPQLRRLARECGAAFGLHLFGVDAVETPDGPLIVDVNDFPNYTGIDEAPEAIGRFILDPTPAKVAP
jgi:ribosomal protein S6--L-glutamate ligase